MAGLRTAALSEDNKTHSEKRSGFPLSHCHRSLTYAGGEASPPRSWDPVTVGGVSAQARPAPALPSSCADPHCCV